MKHFLVISAVLMATGFVASGRHAQTPGDDRSHVAAFDRQTIARLAESATNRETRRVVRCCSPRRPAPVFRATRSASIGGSVGPDLSQIGSKQKIEQIVESVLWPQAVVADEYKAIAVLTADGDVIRGYRVRETDDLLELRDTATGQTRAISRRMTLMMFKQVGTLMPDGLLATFSTQDKADLVAFIADLGKHKSSALRLRSRCWPMRMGITRQRSTCRGHRWNLKSFPAGKPT